MEHFAPIIRRWPTVVTFANEVGCPEKNAREWLRIDSIPAPWFAAVVRASVSRGFIDISADHLASLAERRRLTKSAPAQTGAAA